jgi:hypothetical protein
MEGPHCARACRIDRVRARRPAELRLRLARHARAGLYSSDMSTGDPDPEAVAAVDEFLAGLAPLFP